MQNYSDRFIISESKKGPAEAWEYVFNKIEKETNQEIADFIYHHWKQYKDKK